jgi:hypothetical protein
MLKKDTRTKDKHKSSSSWEEPFVVVDIATLGAYVLTEVDDAMLPNTCNINHQQQRIHRRMGKLSEPTD